MAKKSLKKRIDDLFNAIGRAKKPTYSEIRSELSSLGLLAQELEDGQSLSEKEAAIAALEAENENLKIELQTANAELEAFRAEQRKQEENERKKDLPDIQFKILEQLPSHHSGNWRTIDEIRRAVGGILPDEASIHIDRLEKSNLIERAYNELNYAIWHRAIAGDELVVAKRLACEEEPAKQNARERPDELPN